MVTPGGGPLAWLPPSSGPAGAGCWPPDRSARPAPRTPSRSSAADRLGHIQGAAAGEHAHPPEQRPVRLVRAARSSRRSRPAWSAAGPADRAARQASTGAGGPACPATPPGGAAGSGLRPARWPVAALPAAGRSPPPPGPWPDPASAPYPWRWPAPRRVGPRVSRPSVSGGTAASGRTSGATGYSRPPRTFRATRLVTSMASRGQASSRVSTLSRAASRCSKLSSRTSRCLARSAAASNPGAGWRPAHQPPAAGRSRSAPARDHAAAPGRRRPPRRRSRRLPDRRPRWPAGSCPPRRDR